VFIYFFTHLKNNNVTRSLRRTQATLKKMNQTGSHGWGFFYTGVNRNTLKVRIRELVSAGHVKRHGKGRATWYSRL